MLNTLLIDSQNSIYDAYQLSGMLMQLSNAENINQLLNDLLFYIGENYHRCDFSMQEVTVRFSMLPSNLSSFFKETGRKRVPIYLDGRELTDDDTLYYIDEDYFTIPQLERVTGAHNNQIRNRYTRAKKKQRIGKKG